MRTMCVESFGRFGPLRISNLQQMAADFEGRTQFKRPLRRLYSRWRLSLERSLLFQMADIMLLSLGHSSGLHRGRLTAQGMPGGAGE